MNEVELENVHTYISERKVLKVIWVVNQMTNWGRVNFMLPKCRSFQNNFGTKNSHYWTIIVQSYDVLYTLRGV